MNGRVVHRNLIGEGGLEELLDDRGRTHGRRDSGELLRDATRYGSYDYQYVPASPGYEIVDVMKDDFAVWRDPIVAWALDRCAGSERFAMLIGVGLKGNSGGHGDYWQAIKCPDGTIVPGDGGRLRKPGAVDRTLAARAKEGSGRMKRDDEKLPWNWSPLPKRDDQVTIRMDLYAEQRAEREAERRYRRWLDPYRLGIWDDEWR
jgi:hypothetical protein